MTILLIGLVLFLGVHSIRIFAEPLRDRLITRMGEKGYKGAYTALSLLSFGLICWGYALARASPVPLWLPAPGLRHLAIPGTLIAFVLLAASNAPPSRIKRAVGHPMTVAVMIWALVHLLANGQLADAVLFGSFLVWAVLSFLAARRRDRLSSGGVAPKAIIGVKSDAIVVAVGLFTWLLFAMFLHTWLIGVRPIT